jgi:N-acetyl-anhydromuramyl-L-alanine amidase AmpD
MGAHAKGHNAHSIGICYEGGLDEQGQIADTRTEEQKKAMAKLIVQLKQQFPTIHKVLGHRDLPGVQKACPCFDATTLQPLLHLKCKS